MYRISRCEDRDMEEVAEVEAACFPEDPWDAGYLKKELKDNPFAVFLRLDDEEGIQAYLQYAVTFDSSTIYRLGVKPESRRKGYAKALLDEMEKSFKDYPERVSTSTLEVEEGNKAAIALYESRGYVLATRKKGYYGGKKDALYMVKGL